MKVLHILDSLKRGGAETLELDICRNALANNLDLTLALTGEGELSEDFRNSGIEIIELKRRLPIDLKIVVRLRRIIKSRKIQIVHANQAVEGIHAYLAAFGTEAKLVLSFHGFVPDKKNRQILKFLIPRTAKNIAVSRELLSWLAAEGFDISQNFTVLYNGVDERRLQPSNQNLRRDLKVPNDALLIGMIGNFYAQPRKDQMTLCRALPDFFKTIPNAHCLFVGGFETEAETKFAEAVKFCKQNNILDKTHFLGARRDVPDILAALDVFVLSTLHEGLPIAVIEAMLARVPCVLSDISPNLEISKNGEFAEIFQTQNFNDLSKKLSLLAIGEKQRIKLSKRAYDYAKKEFSIEMHITDLKRLYESIC
ncbi:MAG: glycosyltransferase [Acidobacteriota bacterium]|nr:glycosyltransferase [Acidobacteriota bacterium]